MADYVRVQEIVERLRLDLPLFVDLVDPTGNAFRVEKKNLLSLMAIDTVNLVFEGQSVCALQMEMARAHRAAQVCKDHAELVYRQWKAAKARELRQKHAQEEKKKGPTVAEVEEYYRLDSEYENVSLTPKKLQAIANLFSDAVEAFRLKGRLIERQMSFLKGEEETLRMEAQQERLADMETLENEAAAVFDASGSAQAAAQYLQTLAGSKKRARTPRAVKED